MSFDEFDEMYRECAVAYNHATDAAEAHVWFSYFKAEPTYALKSALRALAQRSEWWPKIAEVTAEVKLQRADYARRQVEAKLRAMARSEGDTGPLRHCVDCDDTGWQYVDGSNPEYRYVMPCPCRATNPVYQKWAGPQRSEEDQHTDPPPHEAKRAWERVQHGPRAGGDRAA